MLRKADINLLNKYKSDLEQLMSQFEPVYDNQPSNEVGAYKYNKMMDYYKQGKTEIILSLENDILLGFAQFFLKDNGRVHLNQIAVSKKYHRKGIGSELIKAIELYAKEHDAVGIELFCNETNTGGMDFYDRVGFQTEKRLLVKSL